MKITDEKKVIQLIFTAIEEINKEQGIEVPLDASTKFFGVGSSLDSLALVNLIVVIEQKVEDELNVSITIADERAMSQKHSPFRTIGSLADYIEMLLKEELND